MSVNYFNQYKLLQFINKQSSQMLPFYPSYSIYNPFFQFPPMPMHNPFPPQQTVDHSPQNFSEIPKEEENIPQVLQSSQEKSHRIPLGPSQLQRESYQISKKLWSEEQDKILVQSVENQALSWKQISKLLPGRNPKMCYNRYKRLSKKKKNLWTREEDEKLKHLVQERKLKWKHLEKYFINRKAKQLRQRYLNFLRPNITREPWTLEQDLKLIQCVNQLGKKWKQIEKILTNRSQNQIKNRYYGRIQHILKKNQSTIKEQSQS